MMRKTKTGLIVIFRVLFISLFLLQACSAPSGKDQNRPEKVKKVRITVEAFRIDSLDAWGYEILINGKTYIHQEFIPALEGKKTFQSKGDALKVGKCVLKKISKRQSPALSREEVRKILRMN
jgi:hypothetical protein